jgi:RNA polymerase sigma-54 factor
MKLAPRMIQSMEILQLPIMALQERIEQEMSDNPMLEFQDEDSSLPDQPVVRKSPDLAIEDSLNDYLFHQLGDLELEPELKELCERIISSLDTEDGYLRCSLQDLLRPDVDPKQQVLAEEALAIVQQFDPPGIAARNLRECLLAKLTTDMLFYDELKTLISNHLDDLANNRMPVIERATGYTIEEIQATCEELRKLDPKPAPPFRRKARADRHAGRISRTR